VVRVLAPATVANLGPGFDALGLALDWYDEVTVEPIERGLEITASGPGADAVLTDETNGIARGVRALLGDETGLRVHRRAEVAFGRGFGSSAISYVAGLVAARALSGGDDSDDRLLAEATRLEGHPDNVAPCLLGGITVCAGGRVARLDPPAGIGVLTCVAPGGLVTAEARAVLAETVSRVAAVDNVGRAGLLVAALASGRADLLFEATADRLHQDARFELMPESAALVRGLRAGGFAAFLSGAGPSVSALVDDARAAAARTLASILAEGWTVRVVPIAARGAHVA